MTNMPTDANFHPFAWTMIAVCLPTYILILILNLPGGLGWWGTMSVAIGRRTAMLLDLFYYQPQWTRAYRAESPIFPQIMPQGRPAKRRTKSTEVAMGLRTAAGTAALFSPSLLSPAISRTISADEMKTGETLRTNTAASPSSTSIKFGFNPGSNTRAQLDILEEEEIGPKTPIKSSAGSAEKEKSGTEEPKEDGESRRHSRSKSLLAMFRGWQGEKEEQTGQPDLC